MRRAVAIAAAGATGAACGGEPPAPIAVGMIASLSGDLAAKARDVNAAALLAVDEINLGGGLLGRPVVLETVDDQTMATGTQLAYGELLRDGVLAVIGPGHSAGAFALADQLRSGHTLTISGSTTAPGLRDLDDDGYYFRTVPGDQVQGTVLAQEIRRGGVDHLCIVHRDDAYGNGLLAVVRAGYQDETHPVIDAPYTPSAASFDGVVAGCAPALAAAHPGIVFVTFEGDGQVLMSDAIGLGWSTERGHQVFLVDGNKSERLYQGLPARGSAFAGAVGTAPGGPEQDTRAGQRLAAFRQRFQARYRRPAGVHSEHNYDAMYLAAIAVAAAGGDRDGVRDAMARTRSGSEAEAGDWAALAHALDADGTVDYLGASGTVDLDPTTGELDPPFYILVWKLNHDGGIDEQRVETVDAPP